MKKQKRMDISKQMISSILILMMLILIIPNTGYAADVKMSQSKLYIQPKTSYTLKLENTKKNAAWSSSNKNVVTVTKGKVTAKKAGKAVVTARLNGKSYTCEVKVYNLLSDCGFNNMMGYNGNWDKTAVSKKEANWAKDEKNQLTITSSKMYMHATGKTYTYNVLSAYSANPNKKITVIVKMKDGNNIRKLKYIISPMDLMMTQYEEINGKWKKGDTYYSVVIA